MAGWDNTPAGGYYMQDNFSGETLVVRLEKKWIAFMIYLVSAATLFMCFVWVYKLQAYTGAAVFFLSILLCLYSSIGDLKLAKETKDGYLVLTEKGIDYCYLKWLTVHKVHLLWSDILSIKISRHQLSTASDYVYIKTAKRDYTVEISKAIIDKKTKEIYAFINKYGRSVSGL